MGVAAVRVRLSSRGPILLAVTDEATAERFYQKFKWDVLAPIEADRWALTPATFSTGWSRRGADGVVRLAVETCE